MLAAWFLLLSPVWFAQAPEKLTVPGASRVTRVDASVMCAGATTTDALPEIRKLGFASVINLRREGEEGVDVPAARAAALANGLRYLHLPVDASNITGETVDAFIAAVTDPANQPVYIHCGSANRVAALWMIKRVIVDRWDRPRAAAEAAAIGLTNPRLEAFVQQYLDARMP